jgi:hypothetical protein
MGTASTTRLTDTDRETITRAREITGIRQDGIRAWTGDDNLSIAASVAFGRAQWEIRGLLDIIGRLGGEV